MPSRPGGGGGPHPSPPAPGEPSAAFRRPVARYTAFGGLGVWRPSDPRPCSGVSTMLPPAKGACNSGTPGTSQVRPADLSLLSGVCSSASFFAGEKMIGRVGEVIGPAVGARRASDTAPVWVAFLGQFASTFCRPWGFTA